MTEGEFIRFYERRNKIKTNKLVKEKIDLFWNVLLKALTEDKKVTFKGWGVFEKKAVKTRKVVIPTWEGVRYTQPKETIKFRAGLELIKIANSDINE